MLAPWKESYDKSKQLIKKQRQRSLCWQRSVWISYGFSSNHVWMWELDHKEGLEQKNWCFQTVVLEKTLESPLDSKEIKSVNPKGNQSWIFIGKADAEAEPPIIWPPDAKKPDSLEKSLILGKIEGRRRWRDRVWDGWMASPAQWTWIWASSGSWWCREAWHATVHGDAKSWTRLSKSTELNGVRCNIWHPGVIFIGIGMWI